MSIFLKLQSAGAKQKQSFSEETPQFILEELKPTVQQVVVYVASISKPADLCEHEIKEDELEWTLTSEKKKISLIKDQHDEQNPFEHSKIQKQKLSTAQKSPINKLFNHNEDEKIKEAKTYSVKLPLYDRSSKISIKIFPFDFDLQNRNASYTSRYIQQNCIRTIDIKYDEITKLFFKLEEKKKNQSVIYNSNFNSVSEDIIIEKFGQYQARLEHIYSPGNQQTKTKANPTQFDIYSFQIRFQLNTLDGKHYQIGVQFYIEKQRYKQCAGFMRLGRFSNKQGSNAKTVESSRNMKNSVKSSSFKINFDFSQGNGNKSSRVHQKSTYDENGRKKKELGVLFYLGKCQTKNLFSIFDDGPSWPHQVSIVQPHYT